MLRPNEGGAGGGTLLSGVFPHTQRSLLRRTSYLYVQIHVFVFVLTFVFLQKHVFVFLLSGVPSHRVYYDALRPLG